MPLIIDKTTSGDKNPMKPLNRSDESFREAFHALD
jgi:hypothetical protein